ncbi:hypothetical protein DUNSADRAFT_18553 [Dunaliella salina]|uniref:Encoded protein n=1 Tax=Dunaliella salina TaxID=3046 RepID=A0ABQ7FZW6_DUNSA|nr:hypothetical protein DUNSADRAFT_18553 [Dunaliella salina]|eukprot:KAF5827895.1 hypothetical protein DUNSADRAFT_18553 [Dunaliella salina]
MGLIGGLAGSGWARTPARQDQDFHPLHPVSICRSQLHSVGGHSCVSMKFSLAPAIPTDTFRTDDICCMLTDSICPFDRNPDNKKVCTARLASRLVHAEKGCKASSTIHLQETFRLFQRGSKHCCIFECFTSD